MRGWERGRLLVWRALGIVLPLAFLLALVGLAGKAQHVEHRAWQKTLTQLEGAARNLASPQRDELLAALVCVKLKKEAGLLQAARGGPFMKLARVALADGVLDASEAHDLIRAARDACSQP